MAFSIRYFAIAQYNKRAANDKSYNLPITNCIFSCHFQCAQINLLRMTTKDYITKLMAKKLVYLRQVS